MLLAPGPGPDVSEMALGWEQAQPQLGFVKLLKLDLLVLGSRRLGSWTPQRLAGSLYWVAFPLGTELPVEAYSDSRVRGLRAMEA